MFISGMSQRITSDKRVPRSACARHLEFARLKETVNDWCFAWNVDKKKAHFPVTVLSPSKQGAIPTPRMSREAKVYRSFLRGEEMNRESEISSGKEQTYHLGKTVQSKSEEQMIKASEEKVNSRCKQSAAVKRYALYRGMLNQ